MDTLLSKSDKVINGHHLALLIINQAFLDQRYNHFEQLWGISGLTVLWISRPSEKWQPTSPIFDFVRLPTNRMYNNLKSYSTYFQGFLTGPNWVMIPAIQYVSEALEDSILGIKTRPSFKLKFNPIEHFALSWRDYFYDFVLFDFGPLHSQNQQLKSQMLAVWH